MDEEAIFSDYSPAFIQPWEPAAYSQVTLRLRTPQQDVSHCTVSLRGDRDQEMIKTGEDGRFAWYAAVVQLDAVKISWFFNVYTADGRRVMYTRRGPAQNIEDASFWNLVPGYSTPEWMCGAVMYQIFVDRFRNGSPENDVLTNEFNYLGARSQHVDDWYRDPAADDVREFYGGDLQGVMEKLDYLQDLGVEVIYFNPLFVSPSNHKYDSQDYDHIDPHIARIVRDGGDLLADGQSENRFAGRYIRRTTDPANLSASDELFADLVREAHSRGIRVIIDGVFNHCGSFNKWMDRERIYESGGSEEAGAFVSADSPYRDFFSFRREGHWPYNPCYDGWWGHDTLPKLNYEGSQKLTDYIMHVARKWVSPPYCADGWRLDVAADLGHSAEFNHEFWKRFRAEVHDANPEAVILAENYGNSAPWLQGSEWDTIMNYEAFMEPLTWFLTGMEKHSDDFRPDKLNDAYDFWKTMTYYWNAEMTFPTMFISMNELSNHDHSRFLTRTNRRVGRLATRGAAAAGEGVDKAVLREAVAIQMTWPGAPTVYYGDEAGLCGWTDPDDRRTYPWGREDMELIRYHKFMISLRRSSPCLRRGALRCMKLDRGFVSYARFLDGEAIITAVNNNDGEVYGELPVCYAGVPDCCELEVLMQSDGGGFLDAGLEGVAISEGRLAMRFPAHSATVFRWKK
ncbi:MAG: glycoside hydrolase family 13 protein [Lachnospiraceae bacterium]|jgi:alpha-glucosidase|nr:glycoside hydrolase family 13 protein [Lachnospiraceae bacterium]